MNLKKILKIMGIIILLIVAIFIVFIIFTKKMDSMHQSDADIMRLRHLKYYSNLIEEYKEKTGEYPLQNRTTQPSPFTEEPKTGLEKFSVYVEIANSLQENEAKNYNAAIPFTHHNATNKEFFNELENGLGREIDEYYDPHKEPYWIGRPNFYVYTINPEGDYYFAIHTYTNYSFSYSIKKNYSKVQVSNLPTRENSIQSSDLFSRKDFIEESEKEPKKADYFYNLENEYLNESKTK